MLLDLAAPADVFGHCGSPYYTFELAALRAGPVRSSTGLDVLATAGLDALHRADTVVVPGVADPLDAEIIDQAARAVADAHHRGARVLSICTGAFVRLRSIRADELPGTGVSRWRRPTGVQGSRRHAPSWRQVLAVSALTLEPADVEAGTVVEVGR
jgi:AraC family transcriptional activator FtrA